MVISVACPACRRPLQFPDNAAGRVAACHCGQQMMLPVAPAAPPPAALRAPSHATPRPRSTTVAPRRPGGGGSGAAPIVVAILLLLGGVAGFVFFKRGKTMEFAKQKEEELAAAKAERLKAEEEQKKYVLLRVLPDDAVLPPDKRGVVEGPAQYIGVRVEVVNHGYESVTVDPVYFTLTVENARYGRGTETAEKFAPVVLKDGEKIVVPLAFEVPDYRKQVVVEFRPAKPEKCNVRYGEAR
jgi:hypothetical protein